MNYTENYFEEVVEKYGEVFFVLDSDRQYEVHGKDSFNFEEVRSNGKHTLVHVEGKHGDEWLKVDFPLEAIEHHYTHSEV